jgi:hypothetical protein
MLLLPQRRKNKHEAIAVSKACVLQRDARRCQIPGSLPHRFENRNGIPG